MKVFCHHLYEYRKGLRNLILHTVSGEQRGRIEAKLKRMGIDYQIYPLKGGNINVFFGAKECVDVIKAIGKDSLVDYTPEEDFILGTMLGYARLQQCVRYLELISNRKFATAKKLLSMADAHKLAKNNSLNNSMKILKKECA